MDSTNMLDLHYHPEELLLHASSALNWNQNPLLNSSAVLQTSSDEHIINPYFTSHMVQDLGHYWAGHGHGHGHHSPQPPHLAKIKNEEQTLLHDLNSFNPASFANGNFGFDPLNFGIALPSTGNIRSLFMPLQTSDQFTRISPCQVTNMDSSPFFDNINYGIQHHLQGPVQTRRCITLHEMPASGNGVNEHRRRNSSGMDHLKASKKPRFEPRPALSPFKVRKEKLGDRIAALQQLVAPFGKTDTASVLMEAIGYIKFLQDQVETLSVPYIGSSNNRKLPTTTEASGEESEEAKPDLRTRGLCLVPLSCTSYVTNDNIVWSPPNFR